jgi:hypothetical protein
MRSQAFFRLLAGPVGSGKTSSCIWEILRRGCEQAAGPDGIRRTRWAIVRQTLQQLRMTVLLDVLTWFRPIARYKVADQVIILAVGDVFIEILLIPLEDPEDQKRLLSSQLTFCWMSEAIEMDADLIPAIAGRVGRYPSKVDGGPTFYGIIADTNMPTLGSPWHTLMDEPPPGYAIFIQPGGLQPDAENLENLPDGINYYLRLMHGKNQSWIDRYVHAKYGEDPGGTAVHRESFKMAFHVLPEIETTPGQMLLIGQDFGRNPCSLIGQVDHRGRVNILKEVVAEDIGLELHVTKFLKPILFSESFAGHMVAAVGDPSGGARESIREETPMLAMIRLGIPCFPAPTNDPDARVRSVDAILQKQIDGGPALRVSRSGCPMLVRALQGAYRYAKTKGGETKALPEKKHPWSDLADALQYICLVINSGMTIYIARHLTPRQVKHRRIDKKGWT